jgi:hypothetical protein
MALIILEECFMKHVEHHEDDVFYWMKKIFQPLLPKTCGLGDPLQSAMVPVSQWR